MAKRKALASHRHSAASRRQQAHPMISPARPTRTPNHLRRRLLFRAGAVLLGVSVFAAAELVCVIAGWGKPSDFDDPFVGFSGAHPLFVLDTTSGQYRIAPSRRAFFAEESFPRSKRPGAFRVFCLGGSTVRGRPYSKPSSFTTWLRISLETGEPDRRWEVVNCGGISYASYRLTPILEECLAYQPDVFVICTGHNEFLEERSYSHIKHAPRLMKSALRAIARLRIFTLMRSGMRPILGGPPSTRSAAGRPLLKSVPDALLDYNNGIKAYHRDENWRAGVIAHYEFNLRRMIAIATKAGVPVILIRPPSNLADCPPFKSQHRDDLSPQELAEWRSLIDSARAAYRSELPRAIDAIKQAHRIDGLFAATWFELGKCYEALQRYGEARAAFLQARELDICPLRILSPMEQALARVARETRTPLIDAHELLQNKSTIGILGGFLLVDHIHPSPTLGHPLIADALASEFVRQGWLAPPAGWEPRKKSAYRRHAESLRTLDGGLYFEHGQRTLQALEAWTKGRATGPPIESRKRPGNP